MYMEIYTRQFMKLIWVVSAPNINFSFELIVVEQINQSMCHVFPGTWAINQVAVQDHK